MVWYIVGIWAKYCMRRPLKQSDRFFINGVLDSKHYNCTVKVLMKLYLVKNKTYNLDDALHNHNEIFDEHAS